MFAAIILKREPFHFRNGSRFCFFLLLVFSVSYSQSDSGYIYSISGGSEYFDLFRQRSENSRTTVFSKNSFAEFSAASGSDSISIALHTSEHYAAVNQKATKFSSSFGIKKQNIDIRYSAQYSFINYAISVGSALNTASRQLNFKVSVMADPFDQLLIGGISLERSPFHYNTSVLFQDFFVPLHDVPQTSNISYMIRSRPFQDFYTEIDYYDTDGENSNLANEYGTALHYNTMGKKLMFRYSFSGSTVLTAKAGTVEFRTDLVLKKSDLSFGDLVKGFGKYSHYTVGIHTDELNLPISVTYSYSQLALSGIGHIESWPFTTLAASIITNRLNYQLSGLIKHHSVEATTDFHFASSSLSAVLSYHRILPDAALEHWEPEFLVFGVKNFTRNPFSISGIHLAGIGFHYEIPIGNISISAYLEQYLPLFITYRRTISTASPSPSEPAATSSAPTTDGGRKAGLFFTVTL
jgi:hypothetical protein